MKLILDIDTGIDDSMALAYALGKKDVDIIGVVCSFGNVDVNLAVENTLKMLKLLGYEDIPVFKGEAKKVDNTEYKHREICSIIHGVNGIGEIELEKSDKEVQKMSGVDFLIESANRYKDDLVIVPVGPLTNIAKAIKKDSSFASKVGKIVIMGGALTVMGNVTVNSEANIHEDPNAAKILFESGANVTMVGLDVTMKTLFSCDNCLELRKLNTNKSLKFADMIDFYIEFYIKRSGCNGCALHDPLAVAVAINPNLVSTISMHMTCLTDKEGYGRTVGDIKKIKLPNPNTKVCLDVKFNEFLEDFKMTLKNVLK